MKIKKFSLNKENEINHKNFKFITLSKIEMYAPKDLTKKTVLKKNDNKYKFPAINVNNTHFSKRINHSGKLEELEKTS